MNSTSNIDIVATPNPAFITDETVRAVWAQYGIPASIDERYLHCWIIDQLDAPVAQINWSKEQHRWSFIIETVHHGRVYIECHNTEWWLSGIGREHIYFETAKLDELKPAFDRLLGRIH